MTEAKIFPCSQSHELAQEIADKYGIPLGKVITSTYSDGEFQPSFEESIRGNRIFIVGSTHPEPKNLMEMLLMLDAAKRASARHITAVMPYFGWARQDRKDKPRVPIAAKMIAKMLEVAGATRIITMDLHADQIQGFFERPVDHLFASTIFGCLSYPVNLNKESTLSQLQLLQKKNRSRKSICRIPCKSRGCHHCSLGAGQAADLVSDPRHQAEEKKRC